MYPFSSASSTVYSFNSILPLTSNTKFPFSSVLYFGNPVNSYVVFPFAIVVVLYCSPFFNRLIVTVGCVVPAGVTHVLFPLTNAVLSCSIVFVKLFPFCSDL